MVAAPTRDDDHPTGLPAIDGDDDAPDAAVDDLEGGSLEHDEDQGGLDDGGFLDAEGEVDELDEATQGTAGDWETAESDPVEEDATIDVPDQSSWVGRAATDGADDLDPTDSDEGDERAPSMLDAGEEGFESDTFGAPLEPEDGATAIGTADDDGLDEALELEGSGEPRAHVEARPLAFEVSSVATEVPAASIVALAALGARAVALAPTHDGDTLVLVEEEAGTLSVRGHAPGTPRVVLAHPRLGIVVGTSTSVVVLGGATRALAVRALVAFGDGLVALSDEGALLSGATLASLAPLAGAPARVALLAPAGQGRVVVVDERGTARVLSSAGAATVVGFVPAREPHAVAAAGLLCAVLTGGGGAWARLDAEVGFEPEESLRGATAIVGSMHGAAQLLALAAGCLLRVTGPGIAEACPLPGGRMLAIGDDGSLLVVTDRELLRVRLPAADASLEPGEGEPA